MKMLIKGEWINTQQTQNVTNPYDQSVIDTVPEGTSDHMLQAIAGAEQGLKTSRNLPLHKRSSILNRAAQLVLERQDDFAQTMSQEGSKTLKEAKSEVGRAAHTLRIAAEEANRVLGEQIAFDRYPGGDNRFGYYVYEPVGIVAAITPYNDALNLVCHKVGPAIAGGNSIIVKPSNHTPLTALKLAEVLLEAGLPKDILSVVTGPSSEVGETLVRDDRVRMISFTGGVKTGTHIAQAAGLKILSMELGSNSPVIVTASSDIQAAAEAVVDGAFAAVGQNCIGVQRVYIDETIYDDFKQRVIELTKPYQVGSQLADDTDIGPMISAQEADRVMEWIQEAQDQGGQVLVGGEREGNLIQPTWLDNVPSSARLAYDEVFGPVAVMKPYETLDEAIEHANAVDYGLHSAIFTRDVNEAFYAVRELDSGSVMVNDSTDYRVDNMPFGGRKKSGIGREGVRSALEEMIEPKVVCFNL